MRTAGILLTGGASRRLGYDKARARLGGTTLSERAARELREACGPVVEVGPGISGLPAVREDPPGAGPLAAILAGVDALGADRVIVLAADLVHVRAPLLRWLATWPGDASVIPVDGTQPQYVCARYGPRAIDEARRRYAVGERSLRWIHTLDPASAVEFPPAELWAAHVGPGAFDDVDTPEDAQRLGIEPPPPGP